MATKVFLKNLKPYSLIAYSYNIDFDSISFRPGEVVDCSGVQINKKKNFELFVQAYIDTGILSLITIYDDTYIPPVLEDGYFDFAYVDYDWVT